MFLSKKGPCPRFRLGVPPRNDPWPVRPLGPFASRPAAAASRRRRERDLRVTFRGSLPPAHRGAPQENGSGIFLPRVNQVHDLDRFGRDPIDQDVIGVDHRLARALDPARPVEEWMLGQPLGTGLDPELEPLRGLGVPLRDVPDDRFDVAARRRKPDQVHSAWRALASSTMAWTRAITSS